MITETRNSAYNKIIEHISDNINTVVQAIADADDPTAPGYHVQSAAWKERYPSLEDLDVLTATHVDDYLPTSLEYPERYPAVVFGFDQAIPNPVLSDSECFIARMYMELSVNRENFKMSQREFFEIHHDLRSIIAHDKAMGVLNELGGVIDQVQWLGFSDLIVDRPSMKNFIISGRAAFEIALREKVNR